MLTARRKRHLRITKRLKATARRLRLVVFRSNKHIYAQLVDDHLQRVITGCSTLSKDFKELRMRSSNKDGAYQVGKLIAQKALGLGIKEVCFDRSGYKYHGRVRALAEGAREGGLRF